MTWRHFGGEHFLTGCSVLRNCELVERPFHQTNREASMNLPVEKKLPTHRAYSIKGEGDTARWSELGAAWVNDDGKGFNFVLFTVPVGGFNGRLTLRAIEPNKE
jgi:hypothetical protein